MDSNYRSTLLRRPQDEADERERRRDHSRDYDRASERDTYRDQNGERRGYDRHRAEERSWERDRSLNNRDPHSSSHHHPPHPHHNYHEDATTRRDGHIYDPYSSRYGRSGDRGTSRDRESSSYRHSSFSLRSPPPRSELPPPSFTSPNSSNHSRPPHHSPPKPDHYSGMPPTNPSAGGPPGGPLPPPRNMESSPSLANPHSSHKSLHPQSTYYAPSASQPPSQTSPAASHVQSSGRPEAALHTSREEPLKSPAPASSGSFYDPTMDATKGRRSSDSWHSHPSSAAQSGPTKPHDPYAYPRPDEHRSFQNSNYASPGRAHDRPRSPPSHSHPEPMAVSPTPSSRSTHALSPHTARHMPVTANGGNTTSAHLHSEPVALSPSRAPPAPTSTPSRAADPMSFSNILSNSEPTKRPPPKSPEPAALREAEPVAASIPKTVVEPIKVPVVEAKDEAEAKAQPAPTDKTKPLAQSDLETEPIKAVKSSLPSTPDVDNETEVEKDDETETEPPSKPLAVKEKKKKPVRKSKGRASEIREAALPKAERRSSIKKESPAPLAPAKRQANGEPKKKTWSPEMERKIQRAEVTLDNDASKLDASEFDEQEYKMRVRKRCRLMEDLNLERSDIRRRDYAEDRGQRLMLHSLEGKRRYDDVFYDEALHEVREQEVYAEKERKKDMQRKRRREKSMAVTMEQREAALTKANEAEDEEERQKYLREAERAGKKAQQTKLILQKGIKGPARKIDLQPEGGNTSSIAGSDAEGPSGGGGGGAASTSTKKSKSRSGNRPKKSKEQKQAEKDSAVAAQAALDAGEELPVKEEEPKVRIKIKKSKDKDKDKSKAAAKKQDGDVDETDDKEAEDAAKDKTDELPDLEKKFTSKGYNQIYDQIWRDMARKDISKTYKVATDSYTTKGSNLKKTAILASKEAKRWQLRTNKGTKDLQARAKRVMRDMMGFWKRNEREERDLRKAAEKQELENARKEEADREAARQKRKLNFLISQTELYSHFIGKKIKTDEVERSTDNPDIAPDASHASQNKLAVKEPTGPVGAKVTNFENLDFDDEDESNLQAAAAANAQNAIAEAQRKAREFNNERLDMDEEGEMNFQNPTGIGNMEIEQPKLINAQLKEYQLKGLNWLVNLYEQGINGILADEMGLGKTVQSISVMAYLAEKHDIWGPFLVVAPASTLHNWQQEIAKFVPEFKILPYWGSAGDRKVLRKFWDRKHSTYRKDAAFHVCVTSYQLVVSDVAYFQKMRWQYMILDEAQAIKSSQSSRWKSLLGFHCRNRLLLTGTPIQNNMQELWALLHFIMPSLFDSHDEFSEWFSKDIESHAQSNTKLNEDQLKRLHMILKPFMLRRVKKHVQKELGDKIEMDVFCNLTYRQRAYYGNLRNQINIMDLVEKATMGDDQDSGTLMNLVMQFRKVCNHPDLFERAEVASPFACTYFAETASFVREGNNVAVGYSTRSMIDYSLPSLIWSEGGRLDLAGRDNQKAGWRNRALQHMMNIWSPEHVREQTDGSKAFSWLRFADAVPGDVYKATHTSLFSRALDQLQQSDRLGQMSVIYDDGGEDSQKFTPAHALFKIRDRQSRGPLADITKEGILNRLRNVAHEEYTESGLNRLEQAGRPGASAPPVEVSCNTRRAVSERDNLMFNVPIRKALYGPAAYEVERLVEKKVPFEAYPVNSTLPEPDHEKKKFTNIVVPSMRRFVTDSGKLAKLDELLFKLKNEGHRVLLYFQMTRMIDLMEEYLTYRNYKYCRLDGSTKLEDRRDTVHDFQTRPDIFIFLLSTRAGGLGINLTSADTVIFYDSDWNPTIDSQAMDRAHRLGQTRQVTVYRLITRGTIEERIRKRALQKEEVQRVVIQGGGASVDFSGRRAPENRNRDIAMWLADDEQAEMIEKREKELLESGELDKQKKKGGRKKKTDAPASLDDMYHEGEGNFDDGNKAGASGTATPAESVTAAAAAAKKPSKSKRAKTTKQRLAMADGMVDM